MKAIIVNVHVTIIRIAWYYKKGNEYNSDIENLDKMISTHHKPKIFTHDLLAHPGELIITSQQQSTRGGQHPSRHHKDSVKFNQRA
jgi:hypothetical protein